MARESCHPTGGAEQRERRSFSVCAIRASHSAEAWPRSRRHPPPPQQRPSARNHGAACVPRRRTAAREPPVLDHPIREARSRRSHTIDSWAVGIASSSHGIAAAPVPAPSAPSPSRWFATLPASNRQAAFPERGASLAPVAIKVAVAFRFPYAWRPTAPVFCALGSRDRRINARQSPFSAIISLWLRKNRLPSGKTQALPIQWVGCSRGYVPYRTINKEKRLRWQLLHIALSARKRRKW